MTACALKCICFSEGVREHGRRSSQFSLLLWPLQSQSEGRDKLHNNDLYYPVQHDFSLSRQFPQEAATAPKTRAGTEEEEEEGTRKQPNWPFTNASGSRLT